MLMAQHTWGVIDVSPTDCTCGLAPDKIDLSDELSDCIEQCPSV